MDEDDSQHGIAMRVNFLLLQCLILGKEKVTTSINMKMCFLIKMSVFSITFNKVLVFLTYNHHIY